MIYQLMNSRLSVNISSVGAELMNLRDHLDVEYIWQGDENTWSRRSPLLFPIIGGMKDGKYIYEGKEYEMTKHGFLRNTEGVVDYYDNTRISITFKSDETTRRSYPFDFEMTVVYELSGNKLVVNYLVKNCDDKTMYFALGFHPGFKLPMDDGSEFEDYYIDFGEAKDMQRVDITMTGFLTGDYSDFKDSKISLNREMFENEAIILKGAPKSVILSSDKVDKEVLMDYPDMDYVALWTLPDERAKYICIEPWTGLVGEEKGVVPLKDVKGIVSLEAGDFYKNEISIQILDKEK